MLAGSHTEAGGPDWPPEGPPDSLEFAFDEGGAFRSDSLAKSPMGIIKISPMTAGLNVNKFIEVRQKCILYFNIRATAIMRVRRHCRRTCAQLFQAVWPMSRRTRRTHSPDQGQTTNPPIYAEGIAVGTGCPQCAQRRAAIGISLRHSGHCFVVAAADGVAWRALMRSITQLS